MYTYIPSILSFTPTPTPTTLGHHRELCIRKYQNRTSTYEKDFAFPTGKIPEGGWSEESWSKDTKFKIGPKIQSINITNIVSQHLTYLNKFQKSIVNQISKFSRKTEIVSLIFLFASRSYSFSYLIKRASQVTLVVKKKPPANAGDVRDMGLIPASGRSPGGEHGNPLQYPCLENPMVRGVWQATVHESHRVGHDWSDSTLSTHKRL